MPTNRAAWQDQSGVELSVRDAPYPTSIGPDQVLIKASAWAINPADYVAQVATDLSMMPFVHFPMVPGEDIAGTVVSVGSAATDSFRTGDRVLGCATGMTRGRPEMGGFQEYAVVDTLLVSHIPATLSFEDACVFPLAVATASHALFSRDFLALPYPQAGGQAIQHQQQQHGGEAVLVWGASSSVGSNAVQLARGAGLRVLATASPRNFDCVTGLAAAKVFDYNSTAVVTDLIAELGRAGCAGIFVAAGNVEIGLQVAHQVATKPHVVTVAPIPEDKVPAGVRATMVPGASILDGEIGPGIFGDFLPKALAENKYIVAPDPMVLETRGLEGIQEGFSILRKGVSAHKVVILAE